MWGACWKRKSNKKKIHIQPKKAFPSARALHMGCGCWRAEGHRQDGNRRVLSRCSGRGSRQQGAHGETPSPSLGEQEPKLLQLGVLSDLTLHPARGDVAGRMRAGAASHPCPDQEDHRENHHCPNIP